MRNIFEKIRNDNLSALLLLAILSVIAYVNSFGASFHFDDTYVIIEDTLIHDIGNLPAILGEYLHRPILRATFALNYLISGDSVAGYHLFNLVLHIMTGFLVFFFIKKISGFFDMESDNTFPLLASLIFTLHPVMTGSVTYISSRSSLLLTVFVFITILLALHGIKKKGGTRYLYFALTFIFYLLSYGVKETAVVIPLLFILLSVLLFYRKKIYEAKPLFVLGLLGASIISIYLYYRYAGLGAVIPVDVRVDEPILSNWNYFLTEMNVIALHYSQWILFPFTGPNPDPDILNERTLFDFSTLFSLVIISLLMLVAVINLKKRPIITLGIAWFFIELAPTSSFIPIADVAVERRLYLPMAGASIVLAYGLYNLLGCMSEKGWLILCSVIFVVMIAFTIRSNSVWATEVSLWDHGAKKSPNKVRVLNNRAWGYYLAGDLNTSEKHYLDIVKKFPEYPYAYNNLGTIYSTYGDHQKSVAYFENAVILKPNFLRLRYNLANAYIKAARFDRAIAEAREVLRVYPNNVDFLYLLGLALEKKGKIANAKAIYKQVLMIDPKHHLSIMSLKAMK